MKLKGKNIIVTGGANGIGRSLVEKLANENAVVGVFDMDNIRLKNIKKKYKKIYCELCDLTDIKAVETAINKFYKEFGSIDVLVNNAGIIYNSPLVSFSTSGIKKHNIAMWKKVIDTDLNSIFYITVNVVEKMIANRTKGIIINVSSVSAQGNAGQSAYSAAKAGVNALTIAWAKELGVMGIRVAGIAPGFTMTQATKKALSEAVLNDWKRKTPVRRLGTPAEIAEGIISIIENDFFNGKILELDGGLILGS